MHAHVEHEVRTRMHMHTQVSALQKARAPGVSVRSAAVVVCAQGGAALRLHAFLSRDKAHCATCT